MKRTVLTVLALLSPAALAGCAIVDSTNTHSEQAYQVTEAVTALSITTRDGRVEVLAGDGPIEVREQYTYAKNAPRTSHNVANGTLTLENKGCDQGGLNRRCGTDYKVTVPAGTKVTVDASAGEVSVTGITGALDLSSHAGKVTGSGLAGPTKVRCNAGEIVLRYASPPSLVDTDSDAGKTSIYLPDAAYELDVKVDAGDTDLGVPSTAGAPNKIIVRSNAGAVKIGRA